MYSFADAYHFPVLYSNDRLSQTTITHSIFIAFQHLGFVSIIFLLCVPIISCLPGV